MGEENARLKWKRMNFAVSVSEPGGEGALYRLDSARLWPISPLPLGVGMVWFGMKTEPN